MNFCGQIFCIVQISVFFSLTCHFPSAMPTSCPVFRYYSSSIAILKIYALRVTEISPGVAIHKICCVSSEIFNLKVPQLPGEAISSDKLCFFIISQFRSIFKRSGGQNRIPRAVFMLGGGPDLTGGARKIRL